MGMRSRAPPVADAARRSIRSGRKNQASEQREDFFGHRKAAGTAIGRGGRETRVAGRERGTAAGRSAGRIDKKFMSILQSTVFLLDKGTMGA